MAGKRVAEAVNKLHIIIVTAISVLVLTSCISQQDLLNQVLTQPKTAEPEKQSNISKGNEHYRSGRYEEAIAEYSKAIELKPKNPLAYSNRGLAYKEMGKAKGNGSAEFSHAIKDFSQAIKWAPEDGSIYEKRGKTYYLMGKCDAAWDDIHDALELKTRVRSSFLRNLRKQCPNYHIAALDKLSPEEIKYHLKQCWGYDPTGQSFGMAVVRGDKEAVELFLAAGLSPDSKHMGDPVLCHAVMSKYFKIALRLIKAGADVNAKDSNGNTPIVHAVTSCMLPQFPNGATQKDLNNMVRALIKAGADVQSKVSTGQTIYEMAGTMKCSEMRAILKKAGAK